MQMQIDKQSIRHKNVEEMCDALNEKCMAHDGFLNYSFLKESEYDYNLPETENPYAYLVFDDSDELVAYLGFLKIDANNMQVCMAVDPKSRRQRIGTNLFLRLVSEFDSYSYSVSLDPDNEIGKAFLETLGFNFASKEISMELSEGDFKFDANPIELNIENDESNEELNADSAPLKITGIINEEIDDKTVEKEIGWLYLIKDENSFCLCDIEVNEEFREKGYGNRLLQTTLRDAFKHADKIILHVTSDNTPAIKLYEKNGFKTLETIDIYEI